MTGVHGYFDRISVSDRQITRGRTITEADLVGFAGLSGDYYALHTDAEYARNTRFGQRIAHGMLVLSYAVGLLELQTGAVLAFYGIEHLRFSRPVFIGDTIHAEIEVVELIERDATSGISLNRLTILNQRNEPVITGLLKWLLARAP